MSNTYSDLTGTYVAANYNIANPIETVGRNLIFINVSKGSAISAAELNSYVKAIQTVATTTVIGAVTVGSSTSFKMVIEGMVTTGSDYKLSGGSAGTYLQLLSELTGVTVTAEAGWVQ